MIDIELDIGYQIDNVGWWDWWSADNALLVDTAWLGPYRDTVSGACVVPEPGTATLLVFGIALLGGGFLRQRAMPKRKFHA